MKPPETVYRGERIEGPAGQFAGVRVTVNGRALSPDRSRRVWDHSPTGFEWGYGGSGPAQLALALVLDATGDRALTERAYQWFKWATVAGWGSTWRITAGEIRAWLEQFERETRAEAEAPACAAVRRCRVCGCTDDDCSECIVATGHPCAWVKGEPDLCSRCAAELKPGFIVDLEGGAS